MSCLETDEKELEKTERSAGEEQPEINQMEVAEGYLTEYFLNVA